MVALLLCSACGVARRNSLSPSERYAMRTGTRAISAPEREADRITSRHRTDKPQGGGAEIPAPAAAVQAAPEGPQTLSLPGHQMVQYAKEFLGTPYKYAANGPDRFDCSGFTCYVYQHFGISLPRTSRDQFSAGRPVREISDIQPGDLVFFARSGQIFHVGIAVESRGDFFTFIHASNSGVILTRSDETYWNPKYYGAKRVL